MYHSVGLNNNNIMKGTEICNYCYPNTILAVKLNRARLLVVLEEILYIHNIKDMKVSVVDCFSTFLCV